MNTKAHLIGGSLLTTASIVLYLSSHAQSADKQPISSPQALGSLTRPLDNAPHFPFARTGSRSSQSGSHFGASQGVITDRNQGSQSPSPDQAGYYWEMQPRPYPVTARSEAFAWTAVDGKTPSVMRQLATNPSNLGQLEDEAGWVNKRQLIYLVDGELAHADEVFQGSRKQLKLPGFGGEEFEVIVEVVQIDETETDDFEGHFEFTFKDDPNTFGVAAVVGDVWSIGYRNADEGVYHQMISRRSGELILTQYDIEAESHHIGGCQCDQLNLEYHHHHQAGN